MLLYLYFSLHTQILQEIKKLSLMMACIHPSGVSGSKKLVHLSLFLFLFGCHDLGFVDRLALNFGKHFSLTDKLRRPGKYTLFLKTVITESKATVFGGESLPSYKLKFTITGKKIHSMASL